MKKLHTGFTIIIALFLITMQSITPMYAQTGTSYNRGDSDTTIAIESQESMEESLPPTPIPGDPFGNLIHSGSAITIDVGSDRVLYEKNADNIMFPASTTKIMTALLTLEHLDLSKSITVPPDAVLPGGASLYLVPGEVIKAEDLLYGLMVKSGNDAAYVLGLSIAGSEDNFVSMMNEKAKQLGCQNTHFMNPHGLHDPQHYTSARDLSIIAKAALEIPKFREVVNTANYDIVTTGGKIPKRSLLNTNKFLWDTNTMIQVDQKSIPIKLDYVHGVKTGTTTEARRCLVSLAKKDGIEVLNVIMKAETPMEYQDSSVLFHYVFNNYSIVPLVKKDEIIGEKNLLLVTAPLQYKAHEDYSILVHTPVTPAESATRAEETEKESSRESANYFRETSLTEQIKTNFVMKENVQLPIREGDEIGQYQIFLDGEATKQIPVYAANSIDSILTEEYLMSHMGSPRIIVPAVILIVVLIAIILLLTKLFKKQKRRKGYRI